MNILDYLYKLLGQICMGCVTFSLIWIFVPVVTKKNISGDKPIRIKIVILIVFVILSILFSI